MIDHPDTLNGPHFDRSLISPSGRLARLHKGGSIPGPSKAQQDLEKEQLALVQEQLKDLERQRQQPTPAAPKPLPPLPPPAATTAADTEQAEAAARRRSLKRFAPGRSTIFAGESSGTLGGRKTILG